MKLSRLAKGLALVTALIPALAAALPSVSPQNYKREQMQAAIDASPYILYHAPVSESQLNGYFGDRSEMLPGETFEGQSINSLFHNVGFLDNLFRPRYDDDWDGPWSPRRNGSKGPVKVPEPTVDEKNVSVVFNHADMKNPNDWKVKYFDLVVVVNKTSRGQYMQAYRKPRGWGMPEPVRFTKTVKVNGKDQVITSTVVQISTGRENAEMSNADKEACERDNSCYYRARELGVSLRQTNSAPQSSYFSQTEPGYYTPEWLSIDHVSAQWEDSAMDHAVFFHNGTATHRAPPKYEKRLGNRASGACVRLSQNHARELFWMVRATGGPIREGEMRQGEKFWMDGGRESDWACPKRALINARRDVSRFGFLDERDYEDVQSDYESCARRLNRFLPKDCTKVRDQAGCRELEKNLPWRCYTTRMKEDPLAQLACLADERARIRNRSKPFFKEELAMAKERGWIPYSAQEQIQIPEFDRYTGQLKSSRLVPGAFKTLIVVENRENPRAPEKRMAAN